MANIVVVPKPSSVVPAPSPLVPTGCSCGECGTCTEPLAHPKFSFGMLLEAKHLSLEHRYNALRFDTHDIRLHDFGTVCGLRVDTHPSAQCVNQYVILRPGLALDCCGREIIVPEDLYVPLFDGAQSGWCGAPISQPLQPAPAAGGAVAPAPAPARTTLYIYLQYRQCDTDPVPSYVKTCGCCGGSGCGECLESNCVLSVTREGYEVIVSTAPPPVWRDPVSNAFCNWLRAQLKREGSGLPDAAAYMNETLQHALCNAITLPCPNTCGGGNDKLLLATVTFNGDADNTLNAIDNWTHRRFVLSSGSIFRSLVCVADAMIACCGQHLQQLPKLQLTGSPNPGSVDLSVVPLNTTIEYHAVATNLSATDPAGAFTLQLVVDPRLKVQTSSCTIGTAAGPSTATTIDAAGTTVSVALPGLTPGSYATLVVDATFVPVAMQSGDSVSSIASIAGYGGPNDGPDTLVTTFSGVLTVDGPRVLYQAIRPTTWEIGSQTLPEIHVPFDNPIDTSTTIALSAAGNPANGTVGLALLVNDPVNPTTIPIAAKLIWPASGPPPSASEIQVAIADPNVRETLKQYTEQLRLRELYLVLTLLGGQKGAQNTPQVAIASPGPNPARLDGNPSTSPPGNEAGKSGDGTQGGPFSWQLQIIES